MGILNISEKTNNHKKINNKSFLSSFRNKIAGAVFSVLGLVNNAQATENQDLNNQNSLKSNIEYVVQKGDALWNIANNYGLNVEELLEFNKYLKPRKHSIKPGEIIIIPRTQKVEEIANKIRTSFEYIVKRNDTLSQIANSHNISLKELLEVNPHLFSRKDEIFPGEKIFIPTGEKIETFSDISENVSVPQNVEITSSQETISNFQNQVLLNEGEELLIQYTVKPGDNLWQIGRNNNVSLNEILEINPIYKSRPKNIFPGEVIFLPNKTFSSTNSEKTIPQVEKNEIDDVSAESENLINENSLDFSNITTELSSNRSYTRYLVNISKQTDLNSLTNIPDDVRVIRIKKGNVSYVAYRKNNSSNFAFVNKKLSGSIDINNAELTLFTREWELARREKNRAKVEKVEHVVTTEKSVLSTFSPQNDNPTEDKPQEELTPFRIENNLNIKNPEFLYSELMAKIISENRGDNINRKYLRANRCGANMRAMLRALGLEGIPDSGMHGHVYSRVLNRLVEEGKLLREPISHPSEARDGALLVYNKGFGPVGSSRYKYGHVELKLEDGFFWGGFGHRPGGSITGANQRTGFTGYAYYLLGDAESLVLDNSYFRNPDNVKLDEIKASIYNNEILKASNIEDETKVVPIEKTVPIKAENLDDTDTRASISKEKIQEVYVQIDEINGVLEKVGNNISYYENLVKYLKTNSFSYLSVLKNEYGLSQSKIGEFKKQYTNDSNLFLTDIGEKVSKLNLINQKYKGKKINLEHSISTEIAKGVYVLPERISTVVSTTQEQIKKVA